MLILLPYTKVPAGLGFKAVANLIGRSIDQAAKVALT